MKVLNFVEAKAEHFDDFLKLKSDPANVFWSGFMDSPDREGFKRHYEGELKRHDRVIVFLYVNEKIAGYIYIDYSIVEKTVETGHGILPRFYGKGLGEDLIKFAIDYSKNNLSEAEFIIAWIAEKNSGSIKNVINNGYIKTDDTELRIFLQRTDKVKFEKYVFDLKSASDK
ncbi:MAG: GNAT family N-acetyltransferase [Cocleimonas sp.]